MADQHVRVGAAPVPSAMPMLAATWCSAPAATIGSWTAVGDAPAERERGALVDRLADDDELVAAEPRDGVGGPHGGRPSARASAISSSSPAAWPKTSLTRLKLSTSTNSTAALRALALGDRERVQDAVAAQRRGWRARSASRAAPAGASAPRRAGARSRSPARWRRPAGTSPPPRRTRPRARRRRRERAVHAVAGVDRHADLARARARARPRRRSRAARRAPRRARRRARSRTRSVASLVSSSGATPRSARSPSAATAACCSDWRRSRCSVSRRSEMLRPIASSSGPSSLATMPQLISPMNSLPSLRRP